MLNFALIYVDSILARVREIPPRKGLSVSVERLIRIVALSTLLPLLNACVVLVPFIESDLPPNAAGTSTSYAYKEACALSKDPIVHFFAPSPVGSLAAVKQEGMAVRGPQTGYQKVSKKERRFQRLVHQLKNGDEVVRTAAASDLGMMGSYARPAVSELSYALQHDRSKWVRRAAARSLGKIGSKDGIPALQHAVRRDANKYVAHSAERSLRRISIAGTY